MARRGTVHHHLETVVRRHHNREALGCGRRSPDRQAVRRSRGRNTQRGVQPGRPDARQRHLVASSGPEPGSKRAYWSKVPTNQEAISKSHDTPIPPVLTIAPHSRGLVPATEVDWLATHADSPWRVLRCSGSDTARRMSPCGAKVRLTHRRGPARFAGEAGTSTARAMVWRSPPEAESCAARRAGGGLSPCSRRRAADGRQRHPGNRGTPPVVFLWAVRICQEAVVPAPAG
jgi:hypothetical protein